MEKIKVPSFEEMAALSKAKKVPKMRRLVKEPKEEAVSVSEDAISQGRWIHSLPALFKLLQDHLLRQLVFVLSIARDLLLQLLLNPNDNWFSK